MNRAFVIQFSDGRFRSEGNTRVVDWGRATLYTRAEAHDLISRHWAGEATAKPIESLRDRALDHANPNTWPHIRLGDQRQQPGRRVPPWRRNRR